MIRQATFQTTNVSNQRQRHRCSTARETYETEPTTWLGMTDRVLSDPGRFRRAVLAIVVLGTAAIILVSLCGTTTTGPMIVGIAAAFAAKHRRSNNPRVRTSGRGRPQRAQRQ